MRRVPLGAVAIALFSAGAIVLILASATWLRTASALVLVASVAIGAFAVATPEFLEEDAAPDGPGREAEEPAE
jgi:hypothetical protein